MYVNILYLNKKLVTFSRSTVAVFCAHDVRCEIEAALAFVLTEPRLCTPGPCARDPARSPRSQRGAQQHSRGGEPGEAHSRTGRLHKSRDTCCDVPELPCETRLEVLHSVSWLGRPHLCASGYGCMHPWLRVSFYVRVCLLC